VKGCLPVPVARVDLRAVVEEQGDDGCVAVHGGDVEGCVEAVVDGGDVDVAWGG
jgi:hypothetical protein